MTRGVMLPTGGCFVVREIMVCHVMDDVYTVVCNDRAHRLVIPRGATITGAIIGGVAKEDSDASGVISAEEVGFAGIGVCISGTTWSGTTLVAADERTGRSNSSLRTTTSVDGGDRLNLPPWSSPSYTLTFTPPSNFAVGCGEWQVP